MKYSRWRTKLNWRNLVLSFYLLKLAILCRFSSTRQK